MYEMVDHRSSELGQVDANLEIREDFWEEVTPESYSPSGKWPKAGLASQWKKQPC